MLVSGSITFLKKSCKVTRISLQRYEAQLRYLWGMRDPDQGRNLGPVPGYYSGMSRVHLGWEILVKTFQKLLEIGCFTKKASYIYIYIYVYVVFFSRHGLAVVSSPWIFYVHVFKNAWHSQTVRTRICFFIVLELAIVFFSVLAGPVHSRK